MLRHQWSMTDILSLSLHTHALSLVGMTSVMVMIGNSSLPETRGTINGVAQSLVAVMRFVGPTLGALSLAWSEQNTDQGNAMIVSALPLL